MSKNKKTYEELLAEVEALRRENKALKEKYRVLRLGVDNIPQAIFWKDQNLTYLGCNQRFASDAGLDSPDKLIGKTDYDMPWTDQADAFRRDDQAVIDTNEAKLNFEEPQDSAAGRIWLRTSKIPIRNQDGDAIGVVGMYEDITQKKREEQNAQIFRQFAENANQGLGMATLDGKTTYANSAIKDIFETDTIVGKMIFPFYRESDLPHLQDVVLPTVMEKGQWSGELPFVSAKGNLKPVIQSIFLIRDENGQPLQLANVITDISEHKRMEEELKNAKDNLEQVVAERTTELEEKIQLIEKQQQTLLELSTPVIKIWDRILILPLIGTFDSRRASQLMEDLLKAILETEAEQVILDITGVPVVDTEVANHLLKTIQASRLLGAECMLVGISSQIAQTLVHLGVDLTQMTTYAKLQKGLLEALTRMKYEISIPQTS